MSDIGVSVLRTYLDLGSGFTYQSGSELALVRETGGDGAGPARAADALRRRLYLGHSRRAGTNTRYTVKLASVVTYIKLN